MWFNYAHILVFMLVAIGFVFFNLLVNRILGGNRPNPVKNAAYECGIEAEGAAWVNFNPRFYLVALLFLVFEVEIALIFPVASVYRDAAFAQTGKYFLFFKVFFFVATLFLAVIYAWLKRDLDWILHEKKGDVS